MKIIHRIQSLQNRRSIIYCHLRDGSKFMGYLWPGPSTRGAKTFFRKKGGEGFFQKLIWGGDFFRVKKGAKTFSSEKVRGRRLFFMQIFTKTLPKYPVNFDRSLRKKIGVYWKNVLFSTPNKKVKITRRQINPI